MKIIKSALLVIILTVSILSSSCYCNPNDDGKDDRAMLRTLLLAYYISGLINPCSGNNPAPLEAAGLPTSTALVGVGGVRGRIETSDGSPVNSAVVIVDDAITGDNVYYGSHTGIDSNGVFIIAGIPLGSGYTLSVEPFNNTYSEVVDYHIDCKNSPGSFTEGWYAGSGEIVSTAKASAQTFDITADNEIVDLGVFSLID